MPRYDLIPKIALDRLAQRFTGEYKNGEPDGGALKYGEGNWEKGLPTSDVINHIYNHLTNYSNRFREVLTLPELNDYSDLATEMRSHSMNDDDLAAIMWGCCVLMHQEVTRMFHDERFKISQQNQTSNGEASLKPPQSSR